VDEYQNIKEAFQSEAIEGVIFDFEGTLFFFDIDWESLKKELHTTHVLPHADAFIGPTLIHLKRTQEDLYNRGLTIIQRFESEAYEQGKCNEKLIELIKTISQKRIGVFSMNTSSVINKFIDQYLSKVTIDPIMSIESIIEPKPSRIDLEKIAKYWNLPKDQIMFIGNSHFDRDSGKMAGIRTILVNHQQ